MRADPVRHGRPAESAAQKKAKSPRPYRRKKNPRLGSRGARVRDLDDEEENGLDLEMEEILKPGIGEVGILLMPEEKDIPEHLSKQREEVQQNFQLPTKSHAEVMLIFACI